MKPLCIFILPFAVGCIEPYPTPNRNSTTHTLVVDGFLNASENVIRLKLSRTVDLISSETVNPESKAQVYIEEKSGPKHLLNEINAGLYERFLNFDPSKHYRIEINTRGKKYFSDFVEVLQSPSIDSLSWRPIEDGLLIMVSTHDTKNNFFLWNHDETWEYTAAFQSGYNFNNGSFSYRTQNEDIHHCWKNFPSTEILIGTTNRLNQNIISESRITNIPLRSEKLLVKYSILVNQLAISQEAYEFWQQLKKNTESLGTLFDPQPSQVTGNIYTEEGEEVLGYFYATTVTQKRLTLALDDLPKSHRYIGDFGLCEEDTVLLADLPKFEPKTFNLVVGVYNLFGSLIGFKYSTHDCTDCILQGGTRQKPNYW